MPRRSLARYCLAAALALLLAACEAEEKPYVTIHGGGFVFNYRIAAAYYGLTLRPMRDLAPGTTLEARFQDPAGGPDIIISKTVDVPRRSYVFETPALKGVRKDVDYLAVVEVRAPETDALLERTEKIFRSSLDQSALPRQPLVIGPGHTPNPAAQ